MRAAWGMEFLHSLDFSCPQATGEEARGREFLHSLDFSCPQATDEGGAGHGISSFS